MSEQQHESFNEERGSADSQTDAIAIFLIIIISVVFSLLWVSNQ